MARDLTIKPRNENHALVSERLANIAELSRPPASNPKQVAAKELMNLRRTVLRAVERSLRAKMNQRPILFVSYSGAGVDLSHRVREIAKEYDFQIKTGFDAEVEIGLSDDDDQEQNLPQAIISQIVSSACFLGIWTHDFENASNKPGRDGRGAMLTRSEGSIPSVWMPFELGIAASHDKPFRLLVQEGTHRLYYEKPFSFRPQIMFGASNFDTKLRSVMEYFERRMRSRAQVGAN